MEDQNETIEDLKSKVGELTEKLTELSDKEKNETEKIGVLERTIETLRKESDIRFEDLSEKDSKLGQELLHQKVKYSHLISNNTQVGKVQRDCDCTDMNDQCVPIKLSSQGKTSLSESQGKSESSSV